MGNVQHSAIANHLRHSADCCLQVHKVLKDHAVKTDLTAHLGQTDLLETLDSVESREILVSRVLPASLEYKVLVVGMDRSVSEVFLVLRDSSDSLERLELLETWDLKVSKALLEFKEIPDSLVLPVTLVALACKDHLAVQVCRLYVLTTVSYLLILLST